MQKYWTEKRIFHGGQTEIRTLDTAEPYAGFQDRCFQPLSHLSPAHSKISFFYLQVNLKNKGNYQQSDTHITSLHI